ncbi:MAG: hypothetical protein HUJ25_07350 [Crocinitomicaceae bacterium]|nr:hypothetical protein [Crocinitomicaceae bacterium]
MLAVFAKHITPRLIYVLDFCFKEKGYDYVIVANEEDWTANEESTLNYSDLQLDCDYAIEPLGLLTENTIDPLLKLEKISNKLALRGDTDPLSVIFYILSRYEEYQPHEKDVHGRFTAEQSSQKILNVLKDPVCDQIVQKLWRKLGLNYQDVKERFELVPSFDIDVAWAYKHRPFWRKVGAFSKGKITERIAVLLKKRKDPYDTYGKIMEVSSKLERIISFAPVSDYGKWDKNISHKNEAYRSLIRGLNSSGGMGLHPGYQSHLHPEIIKEEKRRIEEILGHEMNKSRFHFLRMELPKSYQVMISLGFNKDYSMGYADHIGFRAGTSFPFHFFDLEKNKAYDYLIFPFAYLDSAFKDYMKLSPEEALEEVEELMLKVKDVGGLFMCIWHNHSINDKGEWENWAQVLDKTVEWGREA